MSENRKKLSEKMSANKKLSEKMSEHLVKIGRDKVK